MRHGLKRKASIALLPLTLLATGLNAPVSGASIRAGTLPCLQVPWHNDRCPVWTSVFDHPTGGSEILGSDRAVASKLSPDGSRLFVTGTSTDNDTGRDIVTVAFDTSGGAQRWAARHDSPAEGAEVPNDIAVSPDGTRVFVTGFEDVGLENVGQPSEDGRVVTLAYDAATGGLLWRATYDGQGGRTDIGHSVGVAPDGSEVYVSASAVGEGGAPQHVTLAYRAATGVPEWQAARPSPSGQSLVGDRSDLVVSPDGSHVYVAGSEFPEEGSSARDFVVVAYGTDGQETGQELWSTRHDGGGPDEVRGVDVAPDGGTVFVIGETDPRWSVLAVSSSGEVRWTSTLAGTIEAWPNDLAVSPSGDRVYVTGIGLRSLADPRDSYAATTVAYEASTGEVSWTSEFDPPSRSRDEGIAVGVSADGDTVFVGGFSSTAGGGTSSGGGCTPGATCGVRTDASSMVTLGYDAEGTQLWVGRVDDPPVSPVATAADVSVGEGRVYVAGSIGRSAAASSPQETANYTDMLIAAYPAKLGEPRNFTCAIQPRNEADGSLLGGYGTPQVRADAILVRASDNGLFEAECFNVGDPFGFTVRYRFEFSPQPGTWQALTPAFACSASTVPIGGGGRNVGVIAVPGTPTCQDAEIEFPENHPSLGLPHRFCVELEAMETSGCTASWTHQKIV